MSTLLRNLAVLLCVLALVLVPVLGSAMGGGGIVNLPGGSSIGCNAGGSGLPAIVRNSAQDLAMVVHPTMRGAVVAITIPGLPEATTVVATQNGCYVMTASSIETLIGAGVKALVLDFVAPNLTMLKVNVTFGEKSRVVISFP